MKSINLMRRSSNTAIRKEVFKLNVSSVFLIHCSWWWVASTLFATRIINFHFAKAIKKARKLVSTLNIYSTSAKRLIELCDGKKLMGDVTSDILTYSSQKLFVQLTEIGDSLVLVVFNVTSFDNIKSRSYDRLLWTGMGWLIAFRMEHTGACYPLIRTICTIHSMSHCLY